MKGVGPESGRWGLTFGAAALLLAVAVLSAPLRGVGHGAVETSPSLGVDAEPSGNSATSLGDIDRCVSVGTNATFSIDLWIMDVTDLSGWQSHFQYDGSLLSVVGIEAEMFQAANPGSQVLDLSDPVPDSDGDYFAAAADLVIEASDSGSGVLARVTLQAKGSGRAMAGLASPLLVNKDAMPIGDTDGDTYFDGPTYDAEIAIGLPCSGATASPTATPTATGSHSPTPTPTPTDTVSPTLTLTPGSGVSSQLTAGWNYLCYLGPGGSPGDAMAGIVDEVQAMYRLGPGQAFERWFPDRPDLSTIMGVAPAEALFILMSEGRTWAQQAFGTPPSSAILVQGWNGLCYTGDPKSPADATSAITERFSVLYAFDSSAGWSRFVPGRPELSNAAQLDMYDAVLILATGAGGTTWVFGP